MKILFLISSEGQGKAAGGHFNSLHQVSLEMAKSCEVKIVMLGKVLSPVLNENPYLLKHITLGHSIIDIIRLNIRFNQIFKTFQPEVIHCFDTNSLNRCLLSTATRKIPLILNKCGGPNPLRKNYYHADAIVVFSIENQQWYFDNENYTSDSIFLIPNRVRALDFLPDNLQEVKADPDKITFVRVSRLGGAYEMTLLQTFNLIEKLNKKFPVEFFVIGRITNQEKFNKHVKEGKRRRLPVHYITDHRAAKGSNFLYLADFVVGTGRSFMEATSLGIPSLAPAKNADIPILIDENNVERFLATNFSERSIAKANEETNTLKAIQELGKDDSAYQRHQKKTKHFFYELFGTEKINQKYTAVYDYVLSKPTSRTNLLRKNLIYAIRFLITGK
ncbi:glycosyltransferase family 4 protein [Cyclobacterium sp. SYSU L10401]|uniref:glycosyltransferase family 4 protein n=1 Tax=Cyclobacterium sp. SYSU L10401 TaxID=2678657 RepID=UPI0013D7279F|nr:glycosyltransferase family 4 protein [Cyclobacterium sp. SYSU L10401]